MDQFSERIKSLEKDLETAKLIFDKNAERRVYNSLGFAYYSAAKYKDAEDNFKKSLFVAKEIGDKYGEGVAYGNLGTVYHPSGKYEEAKELHQKSLSCAKEAGDKKGEGRAYGNLATVYGFQGNYEKAIEFLQKHLTLAQEIGDKNSERAAYGNLGSIYHLIGKYEEAVECFKKGLNIAKEIGNKRGEGTAYGNLGNAYRSLGKYEEAIKLYEKYLNIAIQEGDKDGEGTAYENCGALYRLVGRYEKAIKFLQKRLSIAREIGHKKGEETAYGILGDIYQSLGKYEEAIKFQKECISIATEIGDKNAQGIAYGNLGSAYQSLGKYEEALKLYESALSIFIDVGDKKGEGRAYGKFGRAYQLLGKYKEAEKFYKKCLSLVVEIKDKAGEANTLHNLGDLHLSLGEENQHENMKKAARYFKNALQHFEILFDQLGGYDEMKISILDTFISTYLQLIQVLIDLNQKDEALLVSERARARALDDLLLAKYMKQKNDSRSKINNPEDIQTILEGKKFPIIFYALNSDYVVSWLLIESKPLIFHQEKIKSFQTVTCQENESIEEVVKYAFHKMGVRTMGNCEDRSLDTLEVKYESENDEPLLLEDVETIEPHDQKISEMKRGVRCIERPDEENDTDCLEVLYKILISPVQESLVQDEIVLVPDGTLFQVPFAALRDPSSKAFLSDTKRIQIVPSLTALKVLQDSPEDYHMKKGALVIGNPAVSEVMFEGEKMRFCLLPGAELEAKEISSLLGVKPLIGDKATKQEVLRKMQDGVGVVHMATHASTKGQILLAPSLSVRGVPDVKDCMLTMDEIQEVGLRAQLVVLSCCHTGRGEIRAEGVVGLTRAFLAAGARAVVASLWAIDDEATKVFMVHFYSHLKRGETASSSLQQAMKEMRNNPWYSEPRYWAAFFLIGDDVTIDQLNTREG